MSQFFQNLNAVIGHYHVILLYLLILESSENLRLQPSSCVVSSNNSGQCKDAVDGNLCTVLATSDRNNQCQTLQPRKNEEANYNQSYCMAVEHPLMNSTYM